VKNLFTLITILLLASRLTLAGGFQINEQGARAMAMGNAFTALANDPSSLYFNIAGMSQLTGFNMQIGTTLIAPSASFRGPSPKVNESSMVSQVFTPSTLYATYQINSDFSVGFAFNTPFGLGTKWESDWVGRFNNLDTEVRTFTLNPAVSYRITDELSVGAGFIYAFGDVMIESARRLSFFNGEATIHLEGTETSAFGWNAGVLYKPMKDLSFGLSYRSEVVYGFEGTAKTTNAPAQLASSLPAGDITAELVTPQQFTAGVAVSPMQKLMVTADFQYIMWSSYDKLEVLYTSGKVLTSSPKEYEDVFILRLGAEYALDPTLDLRAGFVFDKNPVKDERVDPLLPDADRLAFGVGLGYDLTSDLTVDLAYLFIRFQERTITNSKVNNSGNSDAFEPLNGTYNSTANLFGLTFSYKF